MELLSLKSLYDLFRFLATGTKTGLIIGLLFLGATVWAVNGMIGYMKSTPAQPRHLTASELRNYELISSLETVAVTGEIAPSTYNRMEDRQGVYYGLLTTEGGSFIIQSDVPLDELSVPFIGRFESKSEPSDMQIRDVFWERFDLERLPLTYFVVGEVTSSAILVYALAGFTTTSLALLGIGSFIAKKLGWLPTT